VVDRTAIDGGSGNDVSPALHGTVMAMMAAAPTNGWGMVGTAPQSIQIISVRILQPGQTSFPFSAYATGISVCLQLRKRYDIRVINLSLGDSEVPSGRNYELVGDAILEADDYGVAVVAAAGNDDGSSVEYPAAYPSALSVGASDTNGGVFCSFSNRGEGLRMIAPGCDLDGADPSSGATTYNYWQGTSEASAITSAALTALYAYRPDLSPQAAEQALASANHGVLNIAQAFLNAGLGQLVSEAEVAVPHTQHSIAPSQPTSSQSPPSPDPAIITVSFQRPRTQFKRLKKRLLLVLSNRPADARTQVRYLGYRRHSHRLCVLRIITSTLTTLTLPASGVVEISVRYTDPYDRERSSSWTSLRLPTVLYKNHA
jgi:hypothetical protein